MQVDLVFTPEPEPMPTITQMPDLAPAADLSGAIAGIATLVILALGGLAWRKVSSLLAEMTTDMKATKIDVRATKIQTTNSHDTNLRDDLTEAITKIDNLANVVLDVKTGLTRLDNRQTEMHQDLRETRRDLRFTTEYVRAVDERFIKHTDAEGKTGGSNG
jgi:uncharacterized protein YoxC